MFKRKFIPDDQEGGGVRRATRDALPSLLLTLASGHGYNEALNIRGRDGTFLPETNVLALAGYAVTPERFLPGKSDFVALLTSLHVDAELIANETMRLQMTGSQPSRRPKSPPRPPSPSMPVLQSIPPVNPPADMPRATLMVPPPPLQGPFNEPILPSAPPPQHGTKTPAPPPLQGPFPSISIPPLIPRAQPESLIPPRPVAKPTARRVRHKTTLQPHEIPLPDDETTPNVQTKRKSESSHKSEKRFGYRGYDSEDE